jgi:hypothetical protein
VSAPISDATLRALRVCANTPAELERFLTIYELGYLQATVDALTEQANKTADALKAKAYAANETQKEASK